MSPVTAACPSCGAPVEFRYDDSFVRVCAYCNAVVARGDRGFQSLGRMGDLAVSESPLALAAGGQVGAVGFQLIGRAQIAHARGGGWEEWYARFDNGTWGWLSEAQGRFQLTFSAGTPEGLPPFETLRPGQTMLLSLPDRPPETFTVSEIGEASYRAAAGELPYQLVPGLRFRYADLSGDRGSTATIDAGVEAGDWVAFFVGREVALADLGMAPAAAPVPGIPPGPGQRAGQTVSAVHVACVQCGGSLELRAPDRALRVTCGYCGALLDVDQGHLSYLRTLERDTQMLKPEIPLGSTVDVEEPALTVIGCLRRSVRVDGVDYPFSEYLLYHPALGYRWLVDSDNHWSYVTPLPAGEVSPTGRGVQHGGRGYRHFQTCDARVDRIFGEFYWRVELGERVQMTDYVAPPFMLSSEQAESEINWSRGQWMEPAELVRHIRPPGGEPGSLALTPAHTVAPHQPFRHRGVFAVVAALAALLIAAAIFVAARSPDRAIPLVFDPPLDAPGPATASATPDPFSSLGPVAEAAPASRVHFSSAFELEAHQNVSLDFRAPLVNSWLHVAADLVDEETGLTDSFDVQLESYHGVEGGEAWTEGDRDKNVTLAAVPAGRYVLRIETQWPGNRPAPVLQVGMHQGAFRARYLLGAFGLLLLPSLVIGLLWFNHERQRWADSDHPWTSGGSDE
jgi:hypothetical protein